MSLTIERLTKTEANGISKLNLLRGGKRNSQNPQKDIASLKQNNKQK